MAWYRCGGGGIPSSLKSDMNDVFNKKFGTVLQNYPPEDWPGTVNLMGPLPERTVSGAVASFSDGANDVPLKSASFGIVASGGGGTPSTPIPIVGKSSVTVYHTDGQTPPVESEQVTIQLGQTVYGGQYDSNTGVFTASVEEFTFDGSEDEAWTMYTVNTDQHLFRISNCPRKSGALTASVNQIYSLCNAFTLSTNESTGRTQGKYSGTGTKIDFVNNDCADVSAWRTWLSNNPIQFICELETPIEITGLDEISISTYLGDNTIWCDSGDSEVTYRRDIDLALAQ